MNIKKITDQYALGRAKNNCFLFQPKDKNVNYLLFFIATLISSVFYFLASRNGNLSTLDSFGYKEIAANLATNFSYSKGGIFIVYWPPLYAFILSLAYGGIDSFVHIFHWICLLGILMIWMRIGLCFLSGRWPAVYITSFSVATPLIMLAVFIWSEIFFLLLFSAYILYCIKFIQRRQFRDLMIAALFGFFMLLQRNAGVFLYMGSLAGLLVNSNMLNRRHVASIGLHAVIAVAGFALWNVYIIMVTGNLHIPGELKADFSPGRNFILIFREMGLNVVPGLLSKGAWLAGFLIFVCSGLYAVSVRNSKPPLLYLYIVFFAYVITWLIIPANEHEISRFLAVILPLFYLFMVLLLSILVEKFPRLQLLVATTVVLWIIYSVVRLGNNVLLWGDFMI